MASSRLGGSRHFAVASFLGRLRAEWLALRAGSCSVRSIWLILTTVTSFGFWSHRPVCLLPVFQIADQVNQSPNEINDPEIMSTSPGPFDVCYRPGDCVYIESSPSTPYEICKIESITENRNTGHFEVTVNCFLRRQDIPISLILKAERQYSIKPLTDGDYQCSLREVYYNDIDTKVVSIKSDQILKRCSVVRLMSEVETPSCFIGQEDTFFYRLSYKTSNNHQPPQLGQLEESHIRIGENYQADVPATTLTDPPKEDTRQSANLETQIYSPNHRLTDLQIDQLITVCQSIGTYGRAYLAQTHESPPSILATAAGASRDYTIECAMEMLHKSRYDFAEAVTNFLPGNRPIVCIDEPDRWSNAEMDYFDTAIATCGKKFSAIRSKFLFWKPMKSIIAYYYIWKTSNRRVPVPGTTRGKRKVKQICHSNATRSLPVTATDSARNCESCNVEKQCQSYFCGLVSYILCPPCREYWLRLGSFKYE